MTFFATLSSVESLKQQFQVVEDAIATFPPLEPILQQLAPFLVILLNSMYVANDAFSPMEYAVADFVLSHLSGSILQASLPPGGTIHV
jgi:hypothetical protein